MTRVLGFLIISLFGCKNSTTSSLSIDKKVFDFGIISDTQKVNHNFLLKNNGSDNLIISKISSHCNCTIVNSDSISLSPGVSKFISVSYDPNFYNDSGNVVQTIALRNNSDTPIIFLKMVGFIKRDPKHIIK